MELNPHTDKKMFWEHKLMELINKDNEDGSTLHFEYRSASHADIFNSRKDSIIAVQSGDSRSHTLTIKTYNPKKEATFVLMEILSGSEGECAEAAYQELINMRDNKTYSSYTLEWHKRGDAGVKKSYFYAKNEFEVLTKFYSEMGPENVTFYSLRINPIS